jgi:CRP/FNR family transcriptional regulator
VPLGRVSEFATLTAGEREALGALITDTLEYRRRSPIRHEGAPVQHVYLLTKGWVASSMTLKTGARQFFKVHIPGDILGAPSLASVSAVETLTAITDCTIKCIPLSRLGSIFAEYPRVGMSLFMSANKERIALMDLLAAVGRLSAIERLARFLMELHDRLLSMLCDAFIGLPRILIVMFETLDGYEGSEIRREWAGAVQRTISKRLFEGVRDVLDRRIKIAQSDDFRI